MTIIPYRLRYLIRCLMNLRDLGSAARFLVRVDLPVSFKRRLGFVAQIYRISLHVWCVHSEHEILEVATAVLQTPAQVEGVLVEAGCYKGGSTAKFSLLAKLAGRRLVAFDSFEGLPENQESNQRSIFGDVPNFNRGLYRGGLEEVTENIRRFGDLDSCLLVKGWFEKTLPHFRESVVAAFLDVDLASSTKTCLRFLFPRLQPGRCIFSQDGHLPLVIGVLEDDEFWEREVGWPRPPMQGLHQRKLVRIVKART